MAPGLRWVESSCPSWLPRSVLTPGLFRTPKRGPKSQNVPIRNPLLSVVCWLMFAGPKAKGTQDRFVLVNLFPHSCHGLERGWPLPFILRGFLTQGHVVRTVGLERYPTKCEFLAHAHLKLVFGISDCFLLISREAMRLAPEELGNLLKHEVLFIDKLRT